MDETLKTLKELKEERGFTWVDLSKKTKLSVVSLCNASRGFCLPRPNFRKKIEKAVGMKLDWSLQYEEQQKRIADRIEKEIQAEIEKTEIPNVILKAFLANPNKPESLIEYLKNKGL